MTDWKNALSGSTVVVTRALAQSGELVQALERYGANVLLCPTIEITAPENYELLDEAIDHLYGYDWISFTSVNGVDYFLRRFSDRGHDVSELDALKICAIGDATADALSRARVHVDLVPEESKAEGVFDALSRYVGDATHLQTLNFLLPRAAVARDYLPQKLQAAGARVDVVPAYRTIQPEGLDRGRVAAMLAGGAVDCITFTSASTVKNLAQIFETQDLSETLDGIYVACIGDVTANAAHDFGLEVHIRPIETTVEALAQSIAEYFKKPAGR